MVIELTFKDSSGRTRRVKILVKQLILAELIMENETLIKLIRRERRQNEVLTEIKDLDI